METRNTQYGALELKNIYPKNLRKGMELAVIIHIVFAATYLIINLYNSANATNISPNNLPLKYIDIDMPPSVNDDVKPPDKIVEDIVKPIKDPQSMIPEPVAKEKAEELTIKTQDELNRIIGNTSKDGDSGKFVYNPDGNNGTHDIKIDNNNIKDIPKDPPPRDNFNPSEVDKIPECLNLMQVQHSLVYPELAQQIGREGKVTIRVLVGTDGKVIKIGKISGPEEFYDEVTEKSAMLEFTPGLLGNKPVNVWITVPFTFKLQ